MKLGEYLKDQNLINQTELEEALAHQERAGGKLGDILLAITSMRAQDYYRSLAAHYRISFVQLMKHPIDLSLLHSKDKKIYLEKELIPIAQDKKRITVATSNPSPENFAFIKEHWGENTVILGTSKYDILYVLQKHFKEFYLTESINQLVTENHELSSKFTLSTGQRIFFFLFLVFIIYAAVNTPQYFLFGINVFFTVSIIGILLYKILLSLVSLKVKLNFKDADYEQLPQDDLPVYSILIPLFQESEVTLRNLFNNINKLDYPTHKLDVKVLLEQDDFHTIEILKQLNLPRHIEFVYIPFSDPRTKAKACNYGLHFVRGEFLTLYDAEDKPDPKQLKIALKAFYDHGEEKLACVQCRLNFYNANDNWLTTMFAIEYIYWFDLLLPALEYFHSPIPLGGTSNHFRTIFLRNINAWDPFNVTEDADLGVRLSRLGYTSRVIPSTTYEEATCRVFSWIKQRTRWIKGYMQTYLVHMHNPWRLWRVLGTRGFVGFQLFIGGTLLTNLANIPLWIVFFISYFLNTTETNFLFQGNLLFIAQLNFFIGSLMMIFLNILGVARRNRRNIRFILFAITAPIYWLLMSIASYRALYQLIFEPSHWEKTQHGVSKTLN